MDRYYSAVFEDDRGAILMAVCRGRISEGLDFSDKAARAVIVVGIPYPQMTDPKIILKKEYLDQKQQNAFREAHKPQPTAQKGTSLLIKHVPRPTVLNGKDWYNQQATRAVN